jgi:RNA polymerase sigma factor (sigma-70 family)
VNDPDGALAGRPNLGPRDEFNLRKQRPLVRLEASADTTTAIDAPAARPGPRVPARLLRLASDERLVRYVRGGSEPAFEAIFDRYHRSILAFCRHMLGSVEEAEDAVQHTFMAAYRGLARSRKPIQLRPWLYTIARNRCLSVARARREQPVADVGELPTENLSAEVQRRQDLRDLLRDVAELPEAQRAALVLAEVGAASHDEIAQVLGVKRERVKALVFQARSSLIASRKARETPCAEIRAELAELRGGALRRSHLRRHLKACPGCCDFRMALLDQRKMLALALPVVPTLTLKQGVMAGALGGGAAAAGGAAAGGGAVGGSLLAGGGAVGATAKALAVAAVVGGSAVGVEKAVTHHPVATRPAVERQVPAHQGAAPDAAAAPSGGTTAPAAVTGEPQATGGPPGVPARRPEPRTTDRPAGEPQPENGADRTQPGPRAAGPLPGSGVVAPSGGAGGAVRDSDAPSAGAGSDEPSDGTSGMGEDSPAAGDGAASEPEQPAAEAAPNVETPKAPESDKPAKPEKRGKQAPRAEKTPKPVTPAATATPETSPADAGRHDGTGGDGVRRERPEVLATSREDPLARRLTC